MVSVLSDLVIWVPPSAVRIFSSPYRHIHELTFVVAAKRAATSATVCAGSWECCSTLTTASNAWASFLIGLWGVTGTTKTTPVGLTCSKIATATSTWYALTQNSRLSMLLIKRHQQLETCGLLPNQLLEWSCCRQLCRTYVTSSFSSTSRADLRSFSSFIIIQHHGLGISKQSSPEDSGFTKRYCNFHYYYYYYYYYIIPG